MSLQVWFPLTRDANNHGFNTAVFESANVVSNTEGKLGKSYTFNGSTSKVYTNSIDIDCSKLTLSAWFYRTGSNTETFIAALNNGSDGFANSVIGLDIYDTKLYFIGDGSTVTVNIEKDKWYHAAVTVDGSEVNCYLNGDKVNTFTGIGTGKKTLFTIGARSGSAEGAGTSIKYPFNGKLNDVRLYDEVLTSKEIREISKGLVVHYPFRDPYIEGSNNLLPYPEPTGVPNVAWDAANHPDAITVNGWNDGYVSDVTNPEQGYHAYWKLIDDVPTIVFNDINYLVGLAHRMLRGGASITPTSIAAGSKYTISFEAKANTLDKEVKTGLYFKKTDNLNYAFHDGLTAVKIDKEWKRYSITFTMSETYDPTGILVFYIYGHHGVHGTSYVRNIQLETKDHATPYTRTTRPVGDIEDCSGYGNKGTVSGDIAISNNTPRNEYCVNFVNASTVITHENSLDNTDQEWTCCAWVYPLESAASTLLNNFNNGNYIYLLENSNPIIYLNGNVNDYYSYGNMIIPKDQWTHIAFVFNNKEGLKKVYINGEDRTASGGPNKTSTPRGIPSTVTIGGNYKGYMSDYREYATALSAGDIKELYNAPIHILKNGTIMLQGEVIER